MKEGLVKRISRGAARVGLDFLGVRDGVRSASLPKFPAKPWGKDEKILAGVSGFLILMNHPITPLYTKALSYLDYIESKREASGNFDNLPLEDSLKRRGAYLGASVAAAIDILKFGLLAVPAVGLAGIALFTVVENGVLSIISGAAAEIQDNGRRRILTGTLPE